MRSLGFWRFEYDRKVQTVFFKHMLNVKKSTSHMMLYGELDRFPISIFITKRILGFEYTGGKLSSTMYIIIRSNYINGHETYNWLDNVKSILDDCGYTSGFINFILVQKHVT